MCLNDFRAMSAQDRARLIRQMVREAEASERSASEALAQERDARERYTRAADEAYALRRMAYAVGNLT